MQTLHLKAPAKVNYRLDVLGKLANGYHDLRMVMQRFDLCDDIVIALSERPGIRVTCGRDGVPDGPDNIAWRAADLLLQRYGRNVGIDITISKMIPVAAGLGGGSSDCATVLMGLNEMLELGLSREQLMELGVSLGADVPFFIFGRTALAEGIGERLTAIERIPEAWLVIVNPNFPVSTAWVYQNLKLTSRAQLPIIPRFFDDLSQVCAILANDLESVTIVRHPGIADIKERLIHLGALGALMSGSGPTVFGIFAQEAVARQACKKIAADSDWFAAVAKTL